MCSLLAGIGAGLSALSGYAQYQSQKEAIDSQAKTQAAMYNAQAEAADRNAKIESRKQEQIADNYAREAKDLRSRQRLSAGALRAQTGAAGLDMSGSAMDILSSGQEAYWQDQMTLLGNQRNDNYSSRLQQANYLYDAASNRAAASNVMEQAKRQKKALMWSTVLGTASSIAGSFIGGSGKTGSTASSGISKTYQGNLAYGATTTNNIAGRVLGLQPVSWGISSPSMFGGLGKGR